MEKGSLRNGRGKSTALTGKNRDGRILDKLPGGDYPYCCLVALSSSLFF